MLKNDVKKYKNLARSKTFMNSNTNNESVISEIKHKSDVIYFYCPKIDRTVLMGSWVSGKKTVVI
jgi:hypothetical protein